MTSEEHPSPAPAWHRPLEKFEGLVVAVLSALMVIIVLFILVTLLIILWTRVGQVAHAMDSVDEIQAGALKSFSGVLLVVLGLELIETLKVYVQEHRIRVEVILLVSLIAMGRHVLEIDLHHTTPLTLIAFSCLVLALSLSYFLVKRAHVKEAPAGSSGPAPAAVQEKP